MIVGRDPQVLDEAGITRAAIESLAENASDGIVAPVFWGVLFGLPGIICYKAVNTLDSMIGHRTERHQAFGWAAARLDDVLNWLPARITAGFRVSTDSGTPRWSQASRSRSMSGMTRASSTASGVGAAPGRVDSPPMSMMSAPSARSARARESAATGSANLPPS